MAAITESISNIYNLTVESRDPRAKLWILSHPINFLGIEVLYFLLCLYIGPRFMKNRPPYNLKHVIRVYNIFQITLNFFLFCEGMFLLFFNDFDFRCQEVDFSYNELPVRIVSSTWWFLFSRLMDMWDTVFFVFRKKNNHLSFLHVYHHSLMAFGGWLAVAYQPGGNGVIAGALNSFVHFLMYTYYFITALGPEYKRYIWWKKYLTQLQILQFVIIGIHAFQALFRTCAYPKFMTTLLFFNAMFFIYLFSQFYIKNYLRPKSNDKKD